MTQHTLRPLEREYTVPFPPCGRCKDCDDRPTCKTIAFAQGGTVVTLSMDKEMNADQVAVDVRTTIFNLTDLSIIPRGSTLVNQVVKHQTILTACLANQLVKLQPHKR